MGIVPSENQRCPTRCSPSCGRTQGRFLVEIGLTLRVGGLSGYWVLGVEDETVGIAVGHQAAGPNGSLCKQGPEAYRVSGLGLS